MGGIFGLVLVGLGLYALLNLGKESTDDAQVESDVLTLASRVAGQVRRVPVVDNQQVRKGDLILEIDDAEYLAKSAQARAEVATAHAQAEAADAQVQIAEANAKGGLRSAKAMLTGTSAAVMSADAQIASAKATLERTKIEARKAEQDLERAKELFAANAISRERLDHAQITHESALAALSQAKAGLAGAEESKRQAESRVAEAQGRVSQNTPVEAAIAAARAQAALAHARSTAAEAAARLADLQLSYTKVVSPAEGVVSQLGAHEGSLVQPGQPIAQLVPSDTYVVANFKETQIDKMRPGDRALVEIDAFPGRRLEGKVESLSGGTGARFSLLPPENASGNFVKVVQRIPVRIRWSQPPALPLRAGLSAEVTVRVGTGK